MELRLCSFHLLVLVLVLVLLLLPHFPPRHLQHFPKKKREPESPTHHDHKHSCSKFPQRSDASSLPLWVVKAEGIPYPSTIKTKKTRDDRIDIGMTCARWGSVSCLSGRYYSCPIDGRCTAVRWDVASLFTYRLLRTGCTWDKRTGTWLQWIFDCRSVSDGHGENAEMGEVTKRAAP